MRTSNVRRPIELYKKVTLHFKSEDNKRPKENITIKKSPHPLSETIAIKLTCHFQSLRIDEHEIAFGISFAISHSRNHDFTARQAVSGVRETAVERPHLRPVYYLVMRFWKL